MKTLIALKYAAGSLAATAVLVGPALIVAFFKGY
jgi:hypothetical protein